MRAAIGCDLGGSSAKLALVSQSGDVLAEETVGIGAEASDAQALLEPCARSIDRLCAAGIAKGLQTVAVGCGVPGYFDAVLQQVKLTNIPALESFALGPWLSRRCDLPVVLDNDACAAALAEAAHLPLGGAMRVLVVTVGSGIGVVLVVDGAIVRTVQGVTGDAGHIIVDHASRHRCPLGCRGCLETVATAGALAREADGAVRAGTSPALAAMAAEGKAPTAADVSRAATGGDRAAQEILRRAGSWLGIGLASWAPVYAPDRILLAGGVAAAGEEWLAAALTTMREVGYPHFVNRIAVRRAVLGNRAGAVGAALLALKDVVGAEWLPPTMSK
jgi:glucokinase